MAPPRLVSANECLVDSDAGAPGPHGVAPRESRVRDQPGRRRLHPTLGLGEPRCVRGQRVGPLRGQDRVGEERPGTPRVVVGRVQHHPLAPAQLEHGGSHGLRGRALADLDTQGAGQLGVPDRGAARIASQAQGHLEHDPAVGRGLEGRGSVAEPGLPRRHRPDHPGSALHDQQVRHDLGHLGAVGPHVLDRSGPGRAGDPRQCLQPRPAGVHCGGNQGVPRLPGRDAHEHMLWAIIAGVDPPGGHLDRASGESRIGHEQVRTAADEQHGLAPGVCRQDCLGQGSPRVGDHQRARRTADPQCGQVCQPRRRRLGCGAGQGCSCGSASSGCIRR